MNFFFSFCSQRQQQISSFFPPFLLIFIHIIVVVTSAAYNNSRTGIDVVQRYQQSVAPSDLVYHSTETINEALNPPWALHYQVDRRPATPNLPSNTTDSKTYPVPLQILMRKKKPHYCFLFSVI